MAKNKKQIVKANGEVKAFVDDDLNSIFPVSEYPKVEHVETKIEASNNDNEDEEQSDVAEAWMAEQKAAPVIVLPADIAVARIEAAVDGLQNFELTPGTANLLDRATENIVNSNVSNFTNAQSRADMSARIALLKACDGDLGIALQSINMVHQPKDVPGEVKGLLFTLLKAATFLANIDYRRALDANAEFDYSLYSPIITKGEDSNDKYDADFRQFLVDRREDNSPLEGKSGHPTRHEQQLEAMQELYGKDFQCMEDAVISSLQDLQLFFQLQAEAHGWYDPSGPIPYMVTVENGDTDKPIFHSITSAMEALDEQEVKFNIAKAKRAAKREVTQVAAAQVAAKLVSEMMAKRREAKAKTK